MRHLCFVLQRFRHDTENIRHQFYTVILLNHYISCSPTLNVVPTGCSHHITTLVLTEYVVLLSHLSHILNGSFLQRVQPHLNFFFFFCLHDSFNSYYNEMQFCVVFILFYGYLSSVGWWGRERCNVHVLGLNKLNTEPSRWLRVTLSSMGTTCLPYS